MTSCLHSSITHPLALSANAPLTRLSTYLPKLPETHSIAVFVGAMARGPDNFADAWVDEKISISGFGLSASVACGKVCWYRHRDCGGPLIVFNSSAVPWRSCGILFD
jgi:rRNA pseudouridine-1189 N-methylase Emg1 (Nep1/Mra1 family)